MSEEQFSKELLILAIALGKRGVPCLALALQMLGDMPAEVAVFYVDQLKELAKGENDCPELRSAIEAMESFERSMS